MGFLCISRRINDKILIGKDVELVVADIRRAPNGELIVDIGVKAPNNVKILRKETHLKDLAKNGTRNRR